MLLGKSLVIKLNDVVIASSTSCEIDLNRDTEETSSPRTGEYKSYVAGRKGWNVTCTWLVASQTDMTNKIINFGGEYTLSCVLPGNETIIEGNAICTKCKITATKGNLIKGTFTFLGTGSF